ncbi:class I SAM-dependent methyltransferase [Paraperlucidibaca sp.]|jgi:SAM-dependent methyltransferase|uniref:class I SAM-dependent methyltransferase n=1 Tax=Paraperlucidibaca sp. TaxID=2708021 RepID=UPI003988EE73
MSDSAPVRLHRRLVMTRRVGVLARAAAKLIPQRINSVLDVGAGTGEMAVALQQLRANLTLTGVDVLVRPNTLIPIQPYDGRHLALADKSVDAVMLIDVLHHCDDPLLVMQECLRVSREGVLIKDHIAENRWQRLVLAFMDWVGNRAHHVALPNNYWSSQQWREALQACGIQVIHKTDNLALYPVPFAWIFGGRLHSFWWLERSSEESGHA